MKSSNLPEPPPVITATIPSTRKSVFDSKAADDMLKALDVDGQRNCVLCDGDQSEEASLHAWVSNWQLYAGLYHLIEVSQMTI
jgi:hypothetical protein